MFDLMAAADPRFKVCYFLPHSLQDLAEASFLGGYTPGLLEAASPLMLVATMPADIREPSTERPYRLLQRQLRTIRPMIMPVQSNALEEALTLAPAPFRVCVTTAADVAGQVDAICRDARPPILHVSSLEGIDRLSVHRLNTKGLMTYGRGRWSTVDSCSSPGAKPFIEGTGRRPSAPSAGAKLSRAVAEWCSSSFDF
jgi:hypothetical protein